MHKNQKKNYALHSQEATWYLSLVEWGEEQELDRHQSGVDGIARQEGETEEQHDDADPHDGVAAAQPFQGRA